MNIQFQLVVFTVTLIILLLFIAVKKHKESKRIAHNKNKVLSPEKLKKIMEKIWNENATLIHPEEIHNAKTWLDGVMIKIENGDFKTLSEIETSLNQQNFSKKD